MDRKVEWGEGVFAFLDELLEGDVHGKRVLSLANATLGVMVSASLAVAVIGRSLAQARGLLTRHAIKQVDRLLSNQAIDPWDIAARWVPEIVGSALDIGVSAIMELPPPARHGQNERAMALGRKAWLFAGSDRDGQRAAFFNSLIVTAKLNDVDPQAWLADVLGRIASHPAQRLAGLLPWNWKPTSAAPASLDAAEQVSAQLLAHQHNEAVHALERRERTDAVGRGNMA